MISVMPILTTSTGTQSTSQLVTGSMSGLKSRMQARNVGVHNMPRGSVHLGFPNAQIPGSWRYPDKQALIRTWILCVSPWQKVNLYIYEFQDPRRWCGSEQCAVRMVYSFKYPTTYA